METIYSGALVIASVCAALGALLAFMAKGKYEHVAKTLVSIGFLALAMSLSAHYHFGHSQTSPEPMAIGEFFMAHPSYLVIGALVVIGALLLKKR